MFSRVLDSKENAFPHTTTSHDGTWQQETWVTGDPRIRARTKQLRRAGYAVHTEGMCPQVTDFGLMRLTLIDIRPGSNANCIGIPLPVEPKAQATATSGW
jgi:hypothetical protein